MSKTSVDKDSREARAYTPGLKIKKVGKVNKRRTLPIEGDVLVELGDKVDFDTIIARSQVLGDPTMINVSSKLGLDPVDVPDYFIKDVGDKVKKGEVIAKDIAFFGLLKRFVESPIDGYIESFSKVTGKMILREPPVPISVSAYIPGKVNDILPKRGGIIEVNASIIQGIFGIGGERNGEILLAVSSSDEILSEDKITSVCSEKLVVGGSKVTGKAYLKARKMGVKGIVCGGIDVEELIKVLGEDIGVAITGEEDVETTLIITEGFGEMPISERAFDLLSGHEGNRAAFNGSTQLRAGVIRPEIIIPLEPSSQREITQMELDKGMKIGTLVRIIREPFFGEIAKVFNLPIDLKEIETESHVRVVNVQLKDERIVTIPRTNVEIIQE